MDTPPVMKSVSGPLGTTAPTKRKDLLVSAVKHGRGGARPYRAKNPGRSRLSGKTRPRRSGALLRLRDGCAAAESGWRLAEGEDAEVGDFTEVAFIS